MSNYTDLQCQLAFAAALQHNEHSSTLYKRARKYAELGWPEAAEGTRLAAERLQKVEALNG